MNRAVLQKPLFVALDVDTDIEALRIAGAAGPFVGGFKVGPRLGMRYGAPLIQKLAALGQVFVDNKYFDIPSTMEAAVRASFEAGASFVTIHAQCGREALAQLAKVEWELAQKRPFRILAVTILTSFTADTLPPNSNHKPIADQVLELTQLVLGSGLTGIVCSPEEVSLLRDKFPGAYLVTPGIRLPTDERGDQKRVAGPREALQAGASALVVGRPICEATNIEVAAKRFYDEVQKALS